MKPLFEKDEGDCAGTQSECLQESDLPAPADDLAADQSCDDETDRPGQEDAQNRQDFAIVPCLGICLGGTLLVRADGETTRKL